VARYLFKLMAYKDEYEVARLHTDGTFAAKVGAMFEGDYKTVYHMAPPIFGNRNDRGELEKQRMGAWVHPVLKMLAGLKGLRGTAFDIFGRTAERREERALIDEYRQAIEGMLPMLSPASRDAAAAFARVPEQIRGFGHVKARHLAAARVQWKLLLDNFHSPQTRAHAA
jgi:indolepyruvate ferredoxin oxidoreductase